MFSNKDLMEMIFPTWLRVLMIVLVLIVVGLAIVGLIVIF